MYYDLVIIYKKKGCNEENADEGDYLPGFTQKRYTSIHLLKPLLFLAVILTKAGTHYVSNHKIYVTIKICMNYMLPTTTSYIV